MPAMATVGADVRSEGVKGIAGVRTLGLSGLALSLSGVILRVLLGYGVYGYIPIYTVLGYGEPRPP